MRLNGVWLRVGGLALLGVAGCLHNQPPDLKPPPEPEQLASPGDGDKRYCQPCAYPPETLANDPYKKALQDGTVSPQQPQRKPPGFGGPPPGM